MESLYHGRTMSGSRFRNLFIIALVLVNLVPAAGALLAEWSWGETVYFYWAECVALGALTLFVYLKHLLAFFLVLLISLLALGLTGHDFGADIRLPLMFWGLYSLCWLFYFEIGSSHIGLKLRRKLPIVQFGVYLAFMFSAIAACYSIASSYYPPTAGMTSVTLMASYLLVAAIVPTLAIVVLKIVRIIGEQHFLHFLFGTYHRPIEMQRVVLFMDMIGSTRIAEKLSAKESMRLISQFIFDASAIIHKHGGDIINYTGDGFVVLWPPHQADKAIAAVYAMRSQFERTRYIYEREFGVKPYFRMGLHAGTVIISQIGEEKLFLGLYGDVVNTASRIEQMNKELDTKVLVSEAVREWLSPQWLDRLHSVGTQKISGRQESLELYTLILKPER